VNVWVNGERAEINGARTVAELAARFSLAPHTVLIEHNGVALHQREWPERGVQDGDRLEFVRVVAGG
jgi:thiamine biosynthesis protein ThiS